MIAKQRQIEIIKLLNVQSSVSTQSLSERLGVSQSTIKRDLIELEKEGKLKREHGGAVNINALETLRANDETPILDKVLVRDKEKEAICFLASKLIKDGDLIFVDSGSTPLYLSKYISNKDITVVTNSLLFSTSSHFKGNIILLGGNFDYKNMITTGGQTLNMLDTYRFDLCFLGANGIDINTGEAMVTRDSTALIKRKVLKRSHQKVLLVDHTKFDVQAPYTFSELGSFDVIYSNKKQPIKNLIVSEETQNENN